MESSFVFFLGPVPCPEEVSLLRGRPASPFAPQALPCFNTTTSWSDSHGQVKVEAEVKPGLSLDLNLSLDLPLYPP